MTTLSRTGRRFRATLIRQVATEHEAHEERVRPHIRAFAVVLVTAALLPFVPDEISFFSVSFSAAFLVFVCLALAHHTCSRRTYVVDTPALWLFGFLVLLAISPFTASANDVPFAAWLRGVVPFVFLGTYLLARPGMAVVEVRLLVNTLHLASILWASKVLVQAYLTFISGAVAIVERLTYLTMDLTLPFSLVGLVLSLFNPDPRFSRWRALLTSFFLVIIIASGYRSQALISVLILTVYLAGLPSRYKLALIVGALVFSGGVILTLAKLDLLEAYTARFSETSASSESSRLMEIGYAFDQFAQSPVIGRGLGFPIPVEITFGDDRDFIKQWVDVASVGYIQASVGYIHDLPAYLLMDLGALGLICYFGFMLAGLRSFPTIGRRISRDPQEALRLCPWLIVASILLFVMVEASFRLIQTNLIFSSCVAMLGALRRVTDPRSNLQPEN